MHTSQKRSEGSLSQDDFWKRFFTTTQRRLTTSKDQIQNDMIKRKRRLKYDNGRLYWAKSIFFNFSFVVELPRLTLYHLHRLLHNCLQMTDMIVEDSLDTELYLSLIYYLSHHLSYHSNQLIQHLIYRVDGLLLCCPNWIFPFRCSLNYRLLARQSHLFHLLYYILYTWKYMMKSQKGLKNLLRFRQIEALH